MAFKKGHRINIGRNPWNKGLNKEEYLKHYPNGKTWLMSNNNLTIPIETRKKIGEGLKKSYSNGERDSFFKEGHKLNLGRKRLDLTLRNKIDNPLLKNNWHLDEDKKELIYKNISKGKLKSYASGKTKKMIGEKHPMWLGGLSFEPYDIKFNNEFKNLIRLRDNFCCLNCGISEQKHLIMYGKKLHIHHIDYNKKNTCLINCITLCRKCNLLANYNRREWLEFYQNILNEKYGYNYSKENEIIFNINCKEVGHKS